MADSKEIPKDTVKIFNIDGSVQVAQFQARVERSWAIGDESRATFTYSSRKTEIVNDDVLRFGNYVLLQNDALMDWVGVIDIPRKSGPRVVQVHCYSPEHVFGWRRGPLERTLTGSAGTIFANLLSYVNTAQPTPITSGSIWRGGPQREETINPTPLSEDLLRLYERSQEEYQWRPVVTDSGRLLIYADWLERLGVDTPALLHEGKGGGNLEATSNILVEDGPIINDILAYGEGLTWNTKPNITVPAHDSIARYGLRQSAKEYQGVTSGATLKVHADKELAKFSEPPKTFTLTALNVGDTFKYIRMGNRMNLQFQNIGFSSGISGLEIKVRIIGAHYDPLMKNKIKLVVEVSPSV
jgi:hypothetical protein